MAIYRGPGGPGDATADQASTAQLAQTYANEAENSATAAATSATNAANSATAAASSASAASTSATNAANSATAAETSAGNAETFATAAETSAGNAETFATAAEVSAGNAETSYQNTLAIFGNAEDVAAAVLAAETSAGNSEAFSIISFNHAGNAEAFATAAEVSVGNAEAFSVTASGYADTALSHAGNAEDSATEAAGYASAALSHAGNAEAIYDAFDDRYLGSKSSAPATDNDGNALLTGALYWNSSLSQLYIWDGDSWNAAALDVTGAVTSFNTRTGAVTLSSTDVTNALTFTPLGSSDIGVSVQAYDANTAKYDDVTANFTGTLQNGGHTVLTDASDYLDSTDIGVSVQAYDATILVDADIGVSVQAYDADTVKYDNVNPSFTDTGAIKVPTGTELQRPGTPATGQLRFNTDTAGFEGYDGSAWGEIGGGIATTLSIYTRAETVANVALTNGTLPVTDRSGGTVLVSVS